ncbi:peptidyl-lysine N-acetyltransferase YiaC [Microbulbifer aestuariivivens]|uniref:Peptidyl-lysine N-acetyltransferase YiaC n=1 Tax=Microbulbifer aestuariivivens TaxID=1908308 RepID=A0ABP9WQR5_9GAMM
MLRLASGRDLERLQQLWLFTVVHAHPSLPVEYWQQRLPEFRRCCLGAEACVVYQSALDSVADGFFTLCAGNALPWLCVNPGAVRRGAGSALITEAKRRRRKLHTWVLQDNLGARYFLQEQGFVERERQPAPAGDQHWISMVYQR